MVCIHCSAKTHVINSRVQQRRNQVWRRRQCWDCGATFTTEEAAHYKAAWQVLGVDGDLQPFSRDKLFLSLYKSCEHRKTALHDAGGLVETIVAKLGEYVSNGTLDSRHIVQVTQVALSRFDGAASVHYAAFHA